MIVVTYIIFSSYRPLTWLTKHRTGNKLPLQQASLCLLWSPEAGQCHLDALYSNTLRL
jgi:hypothetical protein